MKQHFGLDISKKDAFICIIDEKGPVPGRAIRRASSVWHWLRG